MNPAIIVGICLFVFLGLIVFSQLKGARPSKEVLDSMDDETIFDPETGEKLTLEEAESYFTPEELELKEKKVVVEEQIDESLTYSIQGLPLSDQRRVWLAEAFLFLLNEFGKEKVIARKVMLPTRECFPYKIQEVHKYSDRVAKLMDIEPTDIVLEFYGSVGKKMDVSDTTFSATSSESTNEPAGLYFGKDENGKYHVSISSGACVSAEKLIPTLAHEFGHIKLLGNDKLKIDNEDLTDMVPLFFGLGIFNANSTFNFVTGKGGWAYSTLGYLSQMDWGYLLALYAFIRDEHETLPEWFEFLNVNTKKDLQLSLAFIKENKDSIFPTA